VAIKSLKMTQQTWTIPITITHEDVFSLLVSALEGGSNYWYADVEPLKRTSKAREACDRLYNNLIEHGFSIVDGDPDDTGRKKTYKVKPEAFQNALEAMAGGNPHPRHFQALLTGNADAETGDVFLQLCVFGEVIYG
jgi:hypothetical protein